MMTMTKAKNSRTGANKSMEYRVETTPQRRFYGRRQDCRSPRALLAAALAALINQIASPFNSILRAELQNRTCLTKALQRPLTVLLVGFLILIFLQEETQLTVLNSSMWRCYLLLLPLCTL